MWILTNNGSHYVSNDAVIRIENNKIVVYHAHGLQADIIKNPDTFEVLTNYHSQIQDAIRSAMRLIDFSKATDYTF